MTIYPEQNIVVDDSSICYLIDRLHVTSFSLEENRHRQHKSKPLEMVLPKTSHQKDQASNKKDSKALAKTSQNWSNVSHPKASNNKSSSSIHLKRPKSQALASTPRPAARPARLWQRPSPRATSSRWMGWCWILMDLQRNILDYYRKVTPYGTGW